LQLIVVETAEIKPGELEAKRSRRAVTKRREELRSLTDEPENELRLGNSR